MKKIFVLDSALEAFLVLPAGSIRTLALRTEQPVIVEIQNGRGEWGRLAMPLIPSEIPKWLAPSDKAFRVLEVAA